MAKHPLRQLHRYISLIISVQLLLWTVSGIYFSFNKIENIRGEQYLIAPTKPVANTSLDLIKIDFDQAKEIINKKT